MFRSKHDSREFFLHFFLDILSEYIDIINSTYRSPSYNKLVKGKKKSLHLNFNAFDFTIEDKEDLQSLYLQLDIWDKEYHFKFLPKAGSMGLGFYEDRFIHLDTRGSLKRKAPKRW